MMRPSALVLLVVALLGCGNVTAADPPGVGGDADAAAGAGGELGTGVAGAAGGPAGASGAAGGTAGAGGATDVGGASGAAGAGGAPDAGAGLLTSGPCAGICAAAITVTETSHVKMSVSNDGTCHAVLASYGLAFSCIGASSGVMVGSTDIGGQCQGALFGANFSAQTSGDGSGYCLWFAPGTKAAAAIGFY